MPGIDLDVFVDGGGSVAITGGVSDISGNYTLTLPGPGTYVIRADATQGIGVADEYFNKCLSPESDPSPRGRVRAGPYEYPFRP